MQVSKEEALSNILHVIKEGFRPVIVADGETIFLFLANSHKEFTRLQDNLVSQVFQAGVERLEPFFLEYPGEKLRLELPDSAVAHEVQEAMRSFK